jgi:hypothetical protein
MAVTYGLQVSTSAGPLRNNSHFTTASGALFTAVDFDFGRLDLPFLFRGALLRFIPVFFGGIFFGRDFWSMS